MAARPLLTQSGHRLRTWTDLRHTGLGPYHDDRDTVTVPGRLKRLADDLQRFVSEAESPGYCERLFGDEEDTE